uniref:Uncharacterized protein n=1 Tax=Arundo donax TaxID=35708 RepID=A0A0A9V895_ARUDO
MNLIKKERKTKAIPLLINRN